MRRAGTLARRQVQRREQRGVALAIVVWFVAGMSLLVAGIVLSSRTDVRMAQMHAAKAKANAAGDGGVNLLMADVFEGRFTARSGAILPRGRYQMGDVEVAVVAVPVDWLVDLNAAPAALITRVLRFSQAVEPDRAEELAAAVVQWRSARSASGRVQRFQAEEDLLGVTGVNRTTLDNLRDYIATPGLSGGLSQPGQRALRIMQSVRSLSPDNRNGAADAPDAAPSARASGYRVDALVEAGGRRWLRRRWVRNTGSQSGLPWSIVRTEPARVVSG